MKIERLRKSHKKEIVIGTVAICVVGGALTFTTSRAKYKLTESIPLARGTVNYKVPDLRTVALYKVNDSGVYVETSDIPTNGYELNTTKSVCRIYDGTTSVENAPIDTNIKINYHDGVIGVDNIKKRNTRCYLYFDKLVDRTNPTISNVVTSATKTEINVTVTASDINENGATVAVSEYWYQLNSNTAVKSSSNTYKFTGLSAGTTYTVKVYVKDATGNQSDITTKSVTTNPNDVTIKSLSSPPKFSYSTNGGTTWTNVTSGSSFTFTVGTIIKSNYDSLYFCSQNVSNCNPSTSSALGYATSSKYYTISGNEAVFQHYCLAEDTLIVMYDEQKKKKRKKKIKDIKAGDKIYTYDIKKKKIVLTTVKKVEVTHNNIICVIKLKNGETIECSKEHGFYIENREFMMACELKPGLKIMGMDGINYEIEDVEIKRYEKDINLYNLLLEDGNTIFVTSLKIMSYATTFMVGMNFTTKRNVVLGTQVDL